MRLRPLVQLVWFLALWPPCRAETVFSGSLPCLASAAPSASGAMSGRTAAACPPTLIPKAIETWRTVA